MDLFLVQHGEAKSEAEDPKRSLADRGGGAAEPGVRHA
jgi:phosphohistidine phosphatase SixA